MIPVIHAFRKPHSLTLSASEQWLFSTGVQKSFRNPLIQGGMPLFCGGVLSLQRPPTKSVWFDRNEGSERSVQGREEMNVEEMRATGWS